MRFGKSCSVVLLTCLVLLGGCGEQRSTFRLLAPAQPFDREIAEQLVEVFESNSRHRIALVPLPDRFEPALDALEAGYADLALASNSQPYRQGISTVMPLYPTVLHILYRRERQAGVFRRAFNLPEPADPEKTEAACRHGVLVVQIPKAESLQPRRISVRAS